MNAVLKPSVTSAAVSDFLADQERKTLLRF